MTSLRIALLGSPVITVDDQPITFPRRKALALLAYLAVSAQPCPRDLLAVLLWPEYDDARANLRRALAALSDTPLAPHLHASRDTITLLPDPQVWVDVQQFQTLLALGQLAEATALYRDTFMAGFSLPDSAEFDTWQTIQAQAMQQRVCHALDQLAEQHSASQQDDRAIQVLLRRLMLDPLHEPAQHALMQLYARTGQRGAALAQYEGYTALLQAELGAQPAPELTALMTALRRGDAIAVSGALLGTLPPRPPLVIGREAVLATLVRRLTAPQAQVILHGWPGIGKTTLAALLAHETALHQHYPDGVLWTSLGQQPHLMNELGKWARALGLSDAAVTPDELSARLAAALRERRALLIVDDAWEAEHALPFAVGGVGCGLLVTTRLPQVAQALASRPEMVYKIPILAGEHALALLRTLAPEVVRRHPQAVAALIEALEGLPLALQVAGRLLHTEMVLGWGVEQLLDDLREGARLLAATAPADRTEVATQTTPTIAALLARSVERLPAETQAQFALLGVFAPKPATFTLDAMQAVWLVDDPRPVVRVLVERGLLEPVGRGIFQMHALLVMQARSMFAQG